MSRQWFHNGAILNRAAPFVVVGGIALSLKLFYSTASVDELRWILAPTTFLVELVSGKQFAFESRAGYMSSDHTFLIAASCAGVNFLITSFLMMSLSRIWKVRGHKRAWMFIPVCLLIAYFATLAANTVRIAVALRLREFSLSEQWLTAKEVHRIEGIVIYFGSLLLLFVLSENLARIRARFSSLTEEPSSRLVRKLIFPLFIYYATTLGLPVLNGAYRNGDFWQHSLVVLLVPLVLLLPLAIVLGFGLASGSES